MRKFIVALLFSLSGLRGHSQDTLNTVHYFRQSIYLEVLGNGYSLASLNYERVFHSPQKKLVHFATRVGFAFTGRSADSSTIFSFPLELTMLLGKRKHFLETGFGWTPYIGKNFTDHTVNPPDNYKSFGNKFVYRLGYRFTDKYGLLIRVAPLLEIFDNPKIRTSFGFSLCLGGSFLTFHHRR